MGFPLVRAGVNAFSICDVPYFLDHILQGAPNLSRIFFRIALSHPDFHAPVVSDVAIVNSYALDCHELATTIALNRVL